MSAWFPTARQCRTPVLLMLAGVALGGANAQGVDALARAEQLLREHLLRDHRLDRLVLQQVAEDAATVTGDAKDWSFRVDDGPLRRRMSVWLEARAGSAAPVVRRVDFEVQAAISGWRMEADMPASQTLDARVATQVEVDAIRHADALRAADLTSYRLRHRLNAGQIIRRDDVVQVGTILRGEPVDVVYRVGAITIRTRGRALEEAAIGQGLRLAVAGSRVPVQGVAAAPGRVDVTDKQELQ